MGSLHPIIFNDVTWQCNPAQTQRFVLVISVNSLAPGRLGCHFKTAIFHLVLLIGIFTLSNGNALRWMPWDLTDDKSTLVQVMAWCRQATSHYLNQCWPSSMSPYGITRPQWVNTLAQGRCGSNFKRKTLKFIIQNSLATHHEIALRWMPQNLTRKSTLVQIMDWCGQAASHYLSQCWQRSILPYGITKPQLVNKIEPMNTAYHRNSWDDKYLIFKIPWTLRKFLEQ